MRRLNNEEKIAVTVAIIIVLGLFVFMPLLSRVAPSVLTSLPTSTDSTGQETDLNDVVIQDLQIGEGIEAVIGASVTVHYIGYLSDGTVFDSSIEREPLSFVLGEGSGILGWEQGLLGMREGGVRALIIPPQFAYESQGIGPIPPDATLVFEIELINVESIE